MSKILDQKFWSQGIPLPQGVPEAHFAPYSGVRKFLFGDFKHLWDGPHYHASHCSGEFFDSQRCLEPYVLRMFFSIFFSKYLYTGVFFRHFTGKW